VVDSAVPLMQHYPSLQRSSGKLAKWRHERLDRTIGEAEHAATKLRLWTGEKGIYSKLFDSPTTMRLNSDWLLFVNRCVTKLLCGYRNVAIGSVTFICAVFVAITSTGRSRP